MTKDVRVVLVPYDSGVRGLRMGAGPEYLVEAGLPATLAADGHRVRVDTIDATPPLAEIRTAFELARTIAARVGDAAAEGALPLVLAGNCSSAVGTVAGIGGIPVVIWLDGHGDFNTPETSVSGFLDGMALAMVTGRCWQTLAARVPRFQPIPERHVILVGARDLDPLERDQLRHSEVTLVEPHRVSTDFDRALRDPSARATSAFVHLDLDVLDPAEGRANALAPPGGLRLDQLLRILEQVGRRVRIGAAALTACDPACDTDGRVARAASVLARAIVAAAI